MTPFYEMKQNELAMMKEVSWSRAIIALCTGDRLKNAVELYDIIEQYRVNLDIRTYTAILSKCNTKAWLEFGKRIHNYLAKNNLMNIISKNCSIHMYSKCGCLEEAIKIFNSINVSERNVITWSAMILVHGQHGKGKEALNLYEEMQKKDKTK